jgi:hypothetical protein
MRLSHFILLDAESKKQAILNLGVLIGKREDGDHKFFLFRMDDYYVEACFSSTTRSIHGFSMFDSEVLLNPYLQAVSLDSIL